MRRFSSYGPVDTDIHYYAPRTELINRAVTQLVGENWKEGGHYITASLWNKPPCMANNSDYTKFLWFPLWKASTKPVRKSSKPLIFTQKTRLQCIRFSFRPA